MNDHLMEVIVLFCERQNGQSAMAKSHARRTNLPRMSSFVNAEAIVLLRAYAKFDGRGWGGAPYGMFAGNARPVLPIFFAALSQTPGPSRARM